MTPRRLLVTLVVAVVIEAAVFGLVHRDLLWLNRPVAELRAASVDDVHAQASSVLAREHLSRRQLEQLADATAQRPDLRHVHIDALERIQALEGADVGVRLRLAEAYRLAGRLDEARLLFAQVLEETAR